MALFGFKRKDKVLDLSERYKRQLERAEQGKKEDSDSSSTNASPFPFFDSGMTSSSSSSNSTNSDTIDFSDTSSERKRRLAKRIADMTEKMEDLSNQIYHLQQRVEVLERKNDIRRM